MLVKKGKLRKKKGGNGNQGDIRYVIEPLDIDGDGIPDGDLIKQIKNDKVIAQKFVAKKKLENIVNQAIQYSENHHSTPANHNEQIIYKRDPQHPEDKPVIIKDDTNFGQYVKMGVGVTVGEVLVKGLVSGLSSLFSSE